MDRKEVLAGLVASLDRKIKSLLIQSNLGLETYQDLLAIDEDKARKVEDSIIELAAYIARLERDRQTLSEMLLKEPRR